MSVLKPICLRKKEYHPAMNKVKLKTRAFELCSEKYTSLPHLARTMGISVSQIYRVRQGKRKINATFIIGAVQAFPGYKLDDLFYVTAEGGSDDGQLGLSCERLRQIFKGSPTLQKPDLRSKAMLTTRQVADLLGLHPNTVRRWNKKGILKACRIGTRGDRKFRREDVDGFLREGESE